MIFNWVDSGRGKQNSGAIVMFVCNAFQDALG